MPKLLLAIMLSVFAGASVVTTLVQAKNADPAEAGYHETKKKKKTGSTGSFSGE